MAKESPETLQAMVDEFVACPPTRMNRKLKLGADLEYKRREVAERLIAGADHIMSAEWDLKTISYWRSLYGIYGNMKDALAVEDQDQLRQLAARSIFRGEDDVQEGL